MFGVLLYTHNELPDRLAEVCFSRLSAAVASSYCEGMPWPECVIVSSRPWTPAHPGWENLTATGRRGLHDCYTKIVAGLERMTQHWVYLVEHDVLYPDGFFAHVPPAGERYWYNTHVYRQTPLGFFSDPTWLTSNCVAERELLLCQFRGRLAMVERGERIVWDEPGRNLHDIAPMAAWRSALPTVDIRWGGNLTGMRTAAQYLQELAPYGRHADLWASYGLPPVTTPAATTPTAPRQPTLMAPDARFQ